jgi:hypothetical protein
MAPFPHKTRINSWSPLWFLWEAQIPDFIGNLQSILLKRYEYSWVYSLAKT